MDQGQMLDKLRRLMPPPAPMKGWGLARLMAMSWALGPDSDQRRAEAEANLRLGAMNVRSNPAPVLWDTDPHSWTFVAQADAPGAAGFYLDDWGKALGVPREPGEIDGLYAPRILSELLRPSTTNVGMALAVDQGIGVNGTQVFEAAEVLKVYRLNSPGLRMNASTHLADGTPLVVKRLNMAGNLDGGTDCSFIVRVPTGAQLPYDEATIRRLVNRRKAAGTRLVGIYTGTGGEILAPDNIPVGMTAEAWVVPVTGATYVWTVTGGTIESGQGTNSITFTAGAPGQIELRLLVTIPAGSTRLWKPVLAYSLADGVITTPEYQYAGTFRVQASVAGPGWAGTVLWTGVDVDFEGPITGPLVTFDVGRVDGLAVLNAQIHNAGGTILNATRSIKVVPYTSDATYTAAELAPGAFVDFLMDLGWEYQLRSQATSSPACVRIYNTDADRTADALRDTATDSGSAAIVHEGIGRTILSFPLPHISLGSNGDTPRTRTAYLRMFNLDTVPRAITLTLTRTETSCSGSLEGALSTSSPTAPSAYSVAQNGNITQHVWAAGLDTHPRTFEIRVGASWLTGMVVTEVATDQTTLLAPAPGPYTYWLASKSPYGLYSAPCMATVTVEPGDVAHDFGEIV